MKTTAIMFLLTTVCCLANGSERIPQSRTVGSGAALSEERDQPALDRRAPQAGGKADGSKLTKANGPSLEGNISFEVSGATVALRAARVINRATNQTTGSLRLELWASAQKYAGGGISGFQTATYQFAQTLKPGQYYDNVSQTVSFREPPAGTYYMSMLLTEYNGGQYLIVDSISFDNTHTFGGGGGAGGGSGGLGFDGNVSYTRNDVRITLRATKIVNRDSNRSGSLKVSLWATVSRYTGGTISGYETSSIDLSALGPNQFYSDVARETAFREPPSGAYWMSMLLSEWSGTAWLVVDHAGFDTQVTFGGGGSEAGRLQLKGTSTYQILGNQLRVTAERIENTMTRGTQALRLELWASSSAYAGGTLTGYTLGSVRFPNTLGANQYLANVDHTVNLDPPPPGVYYMTLLLLEQEGAQFVIRDAKSFPDRQTFAEGANKSLAEMTQPADGATVDGECVDVRWRAGASAVGYHIQMGRTAGSTEYFDAGAGNATSKQVCGLPKDNSLVYLKLWTYFGGDDWQFRNYSFLSSAAAASRTKAEMIAPADQSAIGACAEFRWNTGVNVDEYYLQAGSAPSRNDLFDASVGRDTAKTLCNLPAGRTVYLRLSSRWGSEWGANTYSYSVSGGTGAGPSIQLDPLYLSGCSTLGRRVRISWALPNEVEAQLRINGPSGAPMTGWSRGPGSAVSGDWVTPGMQFFLVDRAGRTLAVERIGSDCTTGASIGAWPTLITKCSNNLGFTSLVWSAPGSRFVRVRVNSTAGADLTGISGPLGQVVTGNWVNNGMAFLLVDENNRELARTVVALACE